MSARADHVVVDANRSLFECRHCGSTQALAPSDMELMRLARLGKKFMAQHAECPAPRPVPPPTSRAEAMGWDTREERSIDLDLDEQGRRDP